MKRQLVLPACLLLLWALTAPISCQDSEVKVPDMTVSEIAGGIKLSCGDQRKVRKVGTTDSPKDKDLELQYSDENTGEYTCESLPVGDEDPVEGPKIYVKFRNCDNCIELDNASVVGLAVGDLVLTVVIGVAVYLAASQTSRINPVLSTSNKKSSDRQHLVSNEGGNRSLNDHYQPLKTRQRDTYDVLTNRK